MVSDLTEPYGYSPADNAVFGGVFIISGVVGSFIFGAILDKTAKFKLMLFVIAVSSTLSVALTFLSLPSKNFYFFTLNLLLVGASVISVIPVSYSFAVELTYPLSEAMSNGMMIMVSQIFGTVVVINNIFFNFINRVLQRPS